MLKIFNISCEEAHAICNKAQYGEATFSEKLKLSLHILICKACALYVKQNKAITKICKSKAEDCKEKQYSLDTKDKELLKEKLKNINS